MHSAFYLKYRPQTFDELIGQIEVKKTLLAGFKNNKLSHAYLFVGPRGSGKTSTARILAKMVNCENDEPTNELTNNLPCNKCDICLSITDGSNLDLIEIDAASNRGIEDIRSLRDKIKLAPTSSRKKVYIIDEVHMLTPEAFNALLKTLEEPPSHVLFILATTELGKIPQTILSRVQRLDFKLATPAELLEVLDRIVKNEKIEIDEEALKILVKKSDGSFRDGIKLLDQVSIGEKITASSVDKNLKISQFETILELLQNFKDKNTKEGLLNISKQIENGTDIKELILSLMDTLRNLVFIKNGIGEKLVKHQFTNDKYEELVKISENFTNQDLVADLNFLQEALEKLKYASIPALPLELALAEICDGVPVSIQTPVVASESTPGPSRDEEEALMDSRYEVISEFPKTDRSPDKVSDDKPAGSDSPDILKIKEKWTFVLETIRPFNFSLEALLRSINVTECTETVVVMEVPYAFHQRILEAPKNRDLLESILSDILGRNIRLSVALGNRPSKAEDIANVELAADDEIIRAAAEIFSSDTVN